MIRVLFVCLGNICRSPMAEAVMRHKAAEKRLERQISVDSAGTAGYHTGEKPHRGTCKMLSVRGISYHDIYSRKLSYSDFECDYIIAMDESNLKDILKAEGAQPEKVRLLSYYMPGESFVNVPDPWYTGDFEETYNLVNAGTDALLHYIVTEHNLLKH